MAALDSDVMSPKIKLTGQIMVGVGILGGVACAGALLTSLFLLFVVSNIPDDLGPLDWTFHHALPVYPVFALLWLVVWIACIRAGLGVMRHEERARRSSVLIVYINMGWTMLVGGFWLLVATTSFTPDDMKGGGLHPVGMAMIDLVVVLVWGGLFYLAARWLNSPALREAFVPAPPGAK